MLDAIHAEGGRTVVVSTSTSALDLIEQLLCSPRGYRTARIDGGTSVDGRQVVVDNFNNLGMGEVSVPHASTCLVTCQLACKVLKS